MTAATNTTTTPAATSRLDFLAPAAIAPWKGNPRKKADPDALKDLEASIIEHGGVLQNIVVRPHPKKKDGFEIIAGERRWKATTSAIEAGKLPKDVTLPCRIVDGCDEAQALAIALSENVDRENMHPLDEAEAYRRLKKLGRDTDAIAEDVGLTRRHVQERIRLAEGLSSTAKAAWLDGGVTIAQAEAIVAVPKAKQDEVVKELKKRGSWMAGLPADELRKRLVDKYPPLEDAIFDPELYKGEWIGKGASRRFADLKQFEKLQRAAVEAKARELKEEWAGGVRIYDHSQGQYYSHDCVKCNDKSRGLAIIEINRHLQVDIREGYISERASPQPTGKASAEATERKPKKPSETITKKHAALAREAKTRALQDAIANHELAAQAAICLALLGQGWSNYDRPSADAVMIRKDPQLGAATCPDEHPALDAAIDDLLKTAVKKKLVKAKTGKGESRLRDDAGLFRWLTTDRAGKKVLPKLHAALVARVCGSWPGYNPDLGDDELVVAMAEVTGARVQDFRLDRDYLDLLKVSRLRQVAVEANALNPDWLKDEAGNMSRKNLIDETLTAFGDVGDPEWVPPEFEFGNRADIARKIDGTKV